MKLRAQSLQNHLNKNNLYAHVPIHSVAAASEIHLCRAVVSFPGEILISAVLFDLHKSEQARLVRASRDCCGSAGEP